MTDSKTEISFNSVEYNKTNVFEHLNLKRVKIKNYLIEIENKLDKIVKIHKDLQSNNSEDFRIGIDALHFQIKLIECDLTNHRTVFKRIENHIYGEYYKLYNTISDYCSHKSTNLFIPEAVHANFPIYKDLDTMKVYDYEVLKEMEKLVDSMIVKLIKGLNSVCEKHQQNTSISVNGIHIEGMITEETYKIHETKERINTFIKYIQTYTTHHSKYFSDLIERIELSNYIINRDVRINTPPETPFFAHSKEHNIFEDLI